MQARKEGEYINKPDKTKQEGKEWNYTERDYNRWNSGSHTGV